MKQCILKNKIVLMLLIVCLLTAFVAVLAACDSKDNQEETGKLDPEIFEENWMSYLSDDTTVGEIAIVGSHDAGTYRANVVWATQHSTIEDQLKAGVRYFDMRATVNIYAEEQDYYFIHADSDMPAIGKFSFGQMVEPSLAAVNDFVNKNENEIVILDFQHTWLDTEEGLIQLMKSTLPMDKVLTKSDCSDPSAITLGEMRDLGKNIIILYKDTTSDVCDENDFLFERSRFLQSDYVGNEHKGDAERLKTQWETYFNDKKDGVIFILQGQLTGSPLKEREGLIRPVLDAYLKDIAANDAEKLAKINVVMKDFVADDVEGCEVTSSDAIFTIISLNVDKGLVKADKLDAFKTACGYGA